MVAGFQVPVTAGLLVELVGRAGGVEFWQSGPIWVKVGVISGVMTMSMVTVLAHCPGSGVKEYVLVPAVKVLMVSRVPGSGDRRVICGTCGQSGRCGVLAERTDLGKRGSNFRGDDNVHGHCFGTLTSIGGKGICFGTRRGGADGSGIPGTCDCRIIGGAIGQSRWY